MTRHVPLHETLWQQNLDLARACIDHPFVRGLADGSLDREAFKRYVAQDAFFLRAFMSAYAITGAKCPDRLETVRRFHRLLDGVLDELELHASYAKSLEIDLENVSPCPATSAYTDFLMRTAWTGKVDEILAAMTPCMRLYAFLGEQLSSHDWASSPYRDWIETYSSAEFSELAAELESLLDELAVESPTIHCNYRYAMRCELDFFSDPLMNEGSVG